MTTKIKFLFIFCLIITIRLIPQYENYRFENLTSINGLSQNSVVSIFQDSRQFLWFGTFDGLNRYDGYNFRMYKSIPGDSSSISGQMISSICEDREGNLWFGSQDGGINKYNRESENFKWYRHNDNKPGSLSNNRIKCELIDKHGVLWVGTENGLNKFYQKSDTFIYFYSDSNNKNSLSDNYINSLCEDNDGNLWIGTRLGLNKFNRAKNSIKRYFLNQGNPNLLLSDFINKIYLNKKNTLWIGTGRGLYKYEKSKEKFISYLPAPGDNTKGLSNAFVTDIMEDKLGNLWIATSGGGLNILDREKETFKHIRNNPFDHFSLSSDIVFTMFEDRSGILWIGTNGGGINKLDFRKSQFTNFKNQPDNKSSLSNDKVYSIVEDKSGDLWIGTFGGGLNKFIPQTYKFVRYTHDPTNPLSLLDDKVRCIYEEHNGSLWIGTDNGIDRFDRKLNKFFHYTESNFSGIIGRSVFSIYETTDGEIWVGTYEGGLNLYDRINDRFTCFKPDLTNSKSIGSNIIRNIYQDKSGIMWICTDLGLDRLDRKKMEFTHFRNDPNNPFSISSNIVLNIYQDKSGILWVGTTLGLNKVIDNPKNGEEIKFIHYTKKDGLPDNNIQGFLEDDQGNFWISTNKGLSKFNIHKLTFKNFKTDDGLLSNEFYANAYLKRKTGELLFGGVNGLTIFNPYNIKDDPYIPPVVFTDFQLFNQPVPIGKVIDGNIILRQSISEAREITLSYKNNIISFEFSALHYSAPLGNNYAYIMEGLESGWNFVGNRRYATYTYLPPGEYTFRVKASNSSGIWNEQGVSLIIKVIPPFWQTWWFRISSGLTIMLIGFVIYKSRVRTIEKRKAHVEKLNELLLLENKERRQAETEMRKAKEEAEKSDKLKSEFLAQMSHEIRTPINAILSFTSLLKDEVSDKITDDLGQSFTIINRAGNRLIRTIDLILNMSQLQTNTYECNYRHFDIYDKILRGLAQQHRKIANDKKLDLFLNKDTEDTLIYADEYTVSQIFENLLNNAIKFTRNGRIDINLKKVEENKLEVEVSDTGVGISDEFLPNLFKPFTQEEGGYTRRFEGNGLGLALVKKYVELNNAKIEIYSKKGEGTKFRVIFNSDGHQT